MDTLLQDLADHAALRAPDSLCLDDGGIRLSYLQVAQRTNQLARLLLETGLEPGARVGIHVPKGAAAVLSMLATLKARGVYVPIDPLAPSWRASTIAADSGLTHLVITRERLLQWLAERPIPETVTTLLVIGEPAGDARPIAAQRWVAWDSHRQLSASQLTGPRAAAGDLAYVLYTSGSTGKPKGVMLSHRNALAFVDWAVAELGVSAADRLSNHAPLHFDLSVFDLYAAFRAGASVVIIGELAGHSPKPLLELMRAKGITIWYSVPSVLRLFLDQTDYEAAPPRTLRVVVFAGEEFPMAPLRRLVAALPEIRYFNWYGPTETNVCTSFEVHASDLQRPALPIGRAASSARLVVRDEAGAATQPGEPGELYVSGPTVLLGYWPHARKPETEYPTGDTVLWDEHGNLLFRGRKDFMVKVRGFRIELREVELALTAHPKISEAVASVADDARLGQVLVAHVAGDAELSVLEVKAHCAKILPGYMVPARVRVLPELPKTSTGKVDRQRLRTEASEAKPVFEAAKESTP